MIFNSYDIRQLKDGQVYIRGCIWLFKNLKSAKEYVKAGHNKLFINRNGAMVYGPPEFIKSHIKS